MEKTPDTEDILTLEKVSYGTISIFLIALLGVNTAIHARSHDGALYLSLNMASQTSFASSSPFRLVLRKLNSLIF